MEHSTNVQCPKCAKKGVRSIIGVNDAGRYQCPEPLCLTLFLELPNDSLVAPATPGMMFGNVDRLGRFRR